jgi:outer membrane protein, heavy metal efflux system
MLSGPVKTNIRHIMTATAFLLCITLAAQVYPENYLEEALQNSPRLQAARIAYDAAAQEAAIVSSLPDPELAVGIFTPPMERLMGNQWFDIRIMQMFPWFGTRPGQRAAAQEMAVVSWHMYREERNSLFMEMTSMWLDIYRIGEQQKVTREFIEILRAREDLIYSRYAAGQSGQVLDFYRLQIQVEDLENRIENLEQEKTALIRSFNILAGRPETALIELPAELAEPGIFAGDPVTSYEFEDNPQLNMARSRAEAAAVMEEISRLMTRPMLGVGIQYSWMQPGDAAMGQMNGGHMVMPMFSVSLPVFRAGNRALRAQAALRAEESVFLVDEQINGLQIRWTRLVAVINNLERDRGFLRRQMELTDLAWELVLTAYGAGERNFDEILNLQDQLLELEWRLLQNTVDLQTRHAEKEMMLAKGIFE